MDPGFEYIRSQQLRWLVLGIFILVALLIPTSNSFGQGVVIVDTTTRVLDGDVSNVEALNNDKGEDGKISIREALAAVNNTGPGNTIRFALPYGSVVPGGYSLKVSHTTIDGGKDGDEKPQVMILGSRNDAVSITVLSSDNIIRNLAFEHMYLCCDADRNRIENSYIGTDITGMNENQYINPGIILASGADHNIIENNIISGNATFPYNPADIMIGLRIHNANFNEIRGNWFGLNVAGERLANDAAIYISGDSEGNIIGGGKLSEDCIYPCNVISGSKGSGIIFTGSGASRNFILGNFIGLNLQGTEMEDNGWELEGGAGVLLRCGASENIIGGERSDVPCDGPCNKIGGNFHDAIMLINYGTTLNKIQGNYIEVSPDHQAPFHVKGIHGVRIQNRSSQVCAGTSTVMSVVEDPQTGQVDYADRGDRPQALADHLDNQEEERSIGDLGEPYDLGPEENLIGGERPGVECTGPCNMFGLYWNAVLLYGDGVDSNYIKGNYMGVSADGSTVLPHWGAGIVVTEGASENTIGGVRSSAECTGPCNVISGNYGPGIAVGSEGSNDNQIQGNFIGLDPMGFDELPNKVGIIIASGPEGTLIGGSRQPGFCVGPCNVIWGNEGAGVEVKGTDAVGHSIGNSIRGNSIFNNGGLGIDLSGDGVTYNNVEGGEFRWDVWMVFPMGTSAFYDEVTDQTTITTTLDVQDPDSAIVDFYGSRELDPTGYGEGEWYFGEAVHVGDGTFELQVPGKLHLPMLSATATNSEGSTSEFGPRPPLILIPGISGSRLDAKEGNNLDEIWLGGPFTSHYRLSLYQADEPLEEIVASDIIRYAFGVSDIYGSLIKFLEEAGAYHEYIVDDIVDRRTGPGCDISQRADHPNMFIFAYDWRLDNKDSAIMLKDYVDCIQRFFPESKIDLLAHSMGGLVSRKFMLEYPDDHDVNKLVTIGTPWLGTPKMIYVLATGDMSDRKFNFLIFRSTLKYVIGSFNGSHQLLPAEAYFNDIGGSPLIESGRDLNSNGYPFDFFDYEEYIDVLDSQLGTAPFVPGTATHQFHSASGQDDWGASGDGNWYYSLIGGQDESWRTIGRVASIYKTYCITYIEDDIWQEDCYKVKAFTIQPYLTEGDGTVTRISSERHGWVPANFHEVRFNGSSYGGDDAVEHTALTGNPFVQESVLGILSHGWDLHSTAGGTPVQNQALNASQNPPINRYLTVGGASTIKLGDLDGNQLVITEDTMEGSAPGVDAFILGERITLFVLPSDGEYSVILDTAESPLFIEFMKGTPTTASSAERYIDLSLPAGVRVSLSLPDSDVIALHYDGDGDGTYETAVEPTVSLAGEDANDLEPPEIHVHTLEQEPEVLLTIDAVDPGSGVDKIRYSLDGVKFFPYVDPLILDRDEGTTITIIADDNAANRRTLVYDFSKPTPLYTIYLPLTMGGD
jgi:pimeloyl-ACP methyl ester carboxylesterase